MDQKINSIIISNIYGNSVQMRQDFQIYVERMDYSKHSVWENSHLEKHCLIPPSLSPYTKINFRLIQHLNIINENLKVLDDSTKSVLKHKNEVRIALNKTHYLEIIQETI